MSVKIGDVLQTSGMRIGEVYASLSGVEVNWYAHDGEAQAPVVARNYAALLVRASEEVERMRAARTEGG